MTSSLEIRNPMPRSGYFLDSGHLGHIKKWKEVIGGITTNQIILFDKLGITDIPTHLTSMCRIVGDGVPISVELPDSGWPVEKMVELATKYRDAHPQNTIIKVPILPNDTKGLKVIARLARKNIPTNATIGVSFGQLTMAAEAARSYAGEGATYISLFWGRAQESFDTYKEGMRPLALLDATLTYLTNHALTDTRVIVGSIREPEQVIEAFQGGADIVTVPNKILKKLLANKRAKETIEEFDRAFRKVEDKIIL